jgi:hypothetical protein
MRSSEILRSIVWHLFTDILGQPIGPIVKGQDFLTLEGGTDTLSRNVANNYHTVLCNIVEQHRSSGCKSKDINVSIFAWFVGGGGGSMCCGKVKDVANQVFWVLCILKHFYQTFLFYCWE